MLLVMVIPISTILLRIRVWVNQYGEEFNKKFSEASTECQDPYAKKINPLSPNHYENASVWACYVQKFLFMGELFKINANWSKTW